MTELLLEYTRDQMQDTVKMVRYNIDALRSATLVRRTRAIPRKCNEGAYRVLNKTIEINNFMVNNGGNEMTMPILEEFLKSARAVLGGDIPIAKTDVDSNPHRALSDVMGILRKAHEKLEEVHRPTAFEVELLAFEKKVGISSGVDYLRDTEDSVDSDEGEPVKKKTKVSGRSTKDTTKRPSKQRGKKEDSDDSEPVRKKSKLSSESTKDTTKKGSKKKSKK